MIRQPCNTSSASTHPPGNDGAPFSDVGNECADDVCENGACSHPPKPDGTGCTDDGNPCTDDMCSGGACTHPPKPYGTGCTDDGNACTDDICSGGVCTHPGECPGDEVCCGVECCDMQSCCGGTECCLTGFCCGNGECCPVECEECLDNGSLSGGSIDVQPNPACIGDTITFTASGVVDEGGIKRVDCSAKTVVPAVSPTYTWELTIPAGYPDPLPPLTGSGTVASVVAEAAGTYSVTFTATADRECPPAPRVIGPATADTCESAAASSRGGPSCGLTMTLKAITFQGDHQMYENAAPGSWGAGDALLPPDWQDVNSADNAVCYTRGSQVRMEVRVEVEASGVETPTLRVLGPDGIQGTVGVTSQCGTVQRTVTLVTTALPNYVTRYEAMSLNWSFQRQGETTWTSIGSTNHHVFVSYGTPSYDDPVNGPPTQWRMHNLCGAGLVADTELEVVEGATGGGPGIHKWLDANPPLDGFAEPPDETQANDWPLMSGFPYYGECHHQAHLMNLAMQVLGLPAGIEYLTYASTDTNVTAPETTTASDLGYTLDLDGNGVVGNETFSLTFDFRPPPGEEHNWNNFEGSIAAAGRYYAVWNSFDADSVCGLYLAIVAGEDATQSWVFDRPDGTLEVYPTSVSGPATCP